VLLACLGLPLLGGCAATSPASVESRDGGAPVPRGYYRVRAGDTLQHIALRHDIEMAHLAQWNGLGPPYRIYTGRLLRLVPDPGAPPPRSILTAKPKPDKAERPARQTAEPASPATPRASRPQATARAAEPAKTTAPVKASASGLRWQWPLSGHVVQGFRAGDRTRQGVRIAGREGQQVVAAEGGTVVYGGSGLKGYGNLIIVKHNNEFLSAYGFNRRLLVKEGQRVRRGEGVAEVGQGPGGEYQLHFEIRRNGIAADPLAYLPRSR